MKLRCGQRVRTIAPIRVAPCGGTMVVDRNIEGTVISSNYDGTPGSVKFDIYTYTWAAMAPCIYFSEDTPGYPKASEKLEPVRPSAQLEGRSFTIERDNGDGTFVVRCKD